MESKKEIQGGVRKWRESNRRGLVAYVTKSWESGWSGEEAGCQQESWEMVSARELKRRNRILRCVAGKE